MPKTPQDVVKPWNPNLANLYTWKALRARCARLEIPQGTPSFTATNVGIIIDRETLRGRKL